MRVCYVITRFDEIGGAQVHVRDLATAMVREGNEVTVIAGTAPPDGFFGRDLARAATFIAVRGLERSIRPFRDLRALSALVRVIRQISPDLVSLHSSKAGILGRIAARRAHVPAVFTAHGWSFSEGIHELKRKIFALIERKFASRAAVIISVSEYDRHLAERLGVLPPSAKAVCIHNAMPDVAEDLRSSPGSAPPRIVCVARFAEPKDHTTLLRSLVDCRDLPWNAVFVGDGPQFGSVQALARDMQLSDRIEFAGHTNHVAEVLARAHLFVLPTKWEGLPRSIIEALRAGLPVVASNVGGVPELVADGRNGLLVPAKDVASLADALKMLLLDAGLRARMSAVSRAKYEDEFTFERMFRETTKQYEIAINQRRMTIS